MTADVGRRTLVGRGRRGHHGPLRVGLIGGFGVGNLGNDASLDAVIRLVRRIDPDVVVTCICPQPEVVSRRFGIAAHSIRTRRPTSKLLSTRVTRIPNRFGDAWRAQRITGSLDALLVPGTGILDDYGGEQPTGWPLSLALWFGAARLRGVRTGLVSIGAGPMAHPVSRRLARLVGGWADYRSFRDAGSRNFMISTGLDVQSTEVAPDIVFSLPWPEPTQQRQDRPLVAIPVMKYRGWYPNQQAGSIGERYTDALGAFCGWLLNEGYAVRLVTADAGDQPATEAVARSVSSTNPELVRRWLTMAVAEDFDDLNRLLSDAAVVVATRYHSVISALICGKPTLSVGYAAKNDELMAAVGLGAYCQHIEHLDQDRLRRQFTDLMAHRRQLSLEVSTRVSEFRGRLAGEEQWLAACLGLAVSSDENGHATKAA